MPFTRRSLIARAAQVSGAAVVASAVPPAALARPHAPTVEVEPWSAAAAARPAAARGRLPRRRRRGGPPPEPDVGRGGARLQLRRPRDRRDLQRRAADDPRDRRRARPRRAVAQRRARPPARRAPVRVAAVLLRRHAAEPGQDVPHAGLGRRRQHARQPDGQGVRPQGGGGSGERVAGARDARPRCRARGPDRPGRGRRRARAVLPLPLRAAEPDQLERRALRVRGRADRQPGAARRTTTAGTCAASSTGRAARCTRAGRATCPRATASSTRRPTPARA